MSALRRPWRLLVWDWDGTIIDNTAVVVSCLSQAAAELGLPPRPAAELRRSVGRSGPSALRYLWPELSPARWPDFEAAWRRAYQSLPTRPALFEGMAGLLRELRRRGAAMAVATGKSGAGLRRALAESGCGDCFLTTRCADDCPSKPDPTMLLEICLELAVEPGLTIMIGDGEVDLAMAAAAGCRAIAAAWGGAGAETLAAFPGCPAPRSVAELSDLLLAAPTGEGPAS